MADYPYRISYGSVLSQVEAYYGQGSPAWDVVINDSATGLSQGGYEYLERIGISPILAQDGSVLGYYQNAAMPSRSGATYTVVDSNAQGATFGANSVDVKINGTATQTEVAGKTQTTFESGAKTVSTGARVATTALNVLTGVGMVAMASRLGMKVNQAFYDSGADWQLTPSQWQDLYWNSDGLGKFLFSTLYGVDGENGTMYMDENALAQAYMTLRDMGVIGGFEPVEPVVGQKLTLGATPAELVMKAEGTLPPAPAGSIGWVQAFGVLQQNVEIDENTYLMLTEDFVNGYYTFIVLQNATDFTIGSVSDDGDYYSLNTNAPSYYVRMDDGRFGSTGRWIVHVGKSYPYQVNRYVCIDNVAEITAAPDGIEKDDQATTYVDPNVVNAQTRPEVLNQLKQNYPQLFDDAIYTDVPQQDGTNKRITYVPVPMPNIMNETQPTTGNNHQNNPSTNPQTNPEDLLQKIIDNLVTPTTPSDVPDTGTGTTPVVPVPTGSASSLWAVYNPTQAEINSFGSWLWSSNLVEQIKKLFNDPMQAIIGVHKVFATPATGTAQNIKCGYIDSGVPAAVVTNQYTTIDCGTVNLNEYFGNVFDYSPFTEISLYLPFIGIVKLDVSDVMRASIKVKYHVDVITGACLADVVVNRDGSGGVLYQYSGSAVVTYPLSSGSYASALAGVVSIAGGIAATIASGGAAAPALLGAAVGVSHLHSDVQKSGSFSGAAGAMGGKKPYLIISRPQTAMPSRYKHLEGMPANHYVKMSSCTGYVKIRQVQVKGLNATDTEMDLIKELLMQGVEM